MEYLILAIIVVGIPVCIIVDVLRKWKRVPMWEKIGCEYNEDGKQILLWRNRTNGNQKRTTYKDSLDKVETWQWKVDQYNKKQEIANKKQELKLKEDREKIENAKREERHAKVESEIKTYCEENNLPVPTIVNERILGDTIAVIHEKSNGKEELFHWKYNQQFLVLYPQNWSRAYWYWGKEFSKIIFVIPCEKILYYTKEGSIEYTNQVKNIGSGGMSLSGAVIGGVIGGATGAVIGASNKAVVLDNKTVEHDNVHTYIYYEDNDGNVKIVDVIGNKFYSEMLRIMPIKEYSYLLRKEQMSVRNSESLSLTNRFRQLDTLKEQNLISDDEYKEKKAELLKML